ncbi:MAG: RagB/SusD family nutrient uptake outer membrane protein [Dysgonamonadaceae bacterium]|nr:RagB/SusD family nutrient uptake outer membrane protein [Dysgonamonadaceae bacterium]
MKNIRTYTRIVALTMLGFASCVDELDQMPHIETTSASVYEQAANYKSVLAKLYASFVISGHEKGGGNADIASDNGENSDYLRIYFNLQEVPTEEIAYTWLEGNNMTNIAYMKWEATDIWVSDMYYRIYYSIALCNEFLRNATDGQMAGFTENEQKDIRTFRLEARFLRALAYFHALDLYGNIPFVSENDPVGAFIPPRYTRAQIFEFVENELKEIAPLLPSPSETEYARATKGAAWTLLAKLYLNAEVYVQKQYYTECIAACKNVFAENYSLEPDYAKLFNADNHLRANEIIFPFAVDAQHTTSWGATTYLVCGAIVTTGSQNAADYGVDEAWGMFRVRPELPNKFAAQDRRALFHTQGQTLNLDVMTDQTQGYCVEKWTNLTDDGQKASNTAADGVNTDFPMFRLADVYLMFAEAVVRGGTGASFADARAYINLLRERAYGDNSGNVLSDSDLKLDLILDERARELYWECTRRTDLIRFGRFTGNSYVWQWKGGVKEGTGTDEKYNIYPIPYTELSANPNLTNENY